MDTKTIAILIVCIAAALIAGCTTSMVPPGTATLTQTARIPDVTTAPADVRSCTRAEDCVPAQCCHPTGCTGRAAAPSCSAVICTMSCEGPIDCGAGSCGCVEGRCSVVVAPVATGPAGQKPSVHIAASPQRYSPVMSSTPGIRLAPVVTGFSVTDATFEWNATFGRFLTWDAPEYQVHDIGNPVATDNRTIYWTFTDKPAPAKDPVTITVTARDMTRQGAVLGTSAVTLSWDGDYEVYVDGIP